VDRSEQRDFVYSLARHAVGSVAPEELAFFAATSESYFRDPDHALADRHRSDQVLGSGFDIVVTLISPVALAVAAGVYQLLTEKAGEAVARKGLRLLGRLRRNGKEAEARPVSLPLTDEQRVEVRRVAEERARALGLTEDQVRLLVGAILDGLDRRE
jgi:hypothetical protein